MDTRPEIDQMRLGATWSPDRGTDFLVWAPKAHRVDVHLLGEGGDRLLPMTQLERGYFALSAPDVLPGRGYYYRLDGALERPDPASYFQPTGVHGPSQVVEGSFAWQDGARCGLPFEQYVIYELHIGTFTPAGTFRAVIDQLDQLAELGITAIELMPVAQFPGERNWGYDGVHLFAPQNSYGGPDALKALVDAAHLRGLAVVLDVVYNHLGPEGNYLADFGHYFTDRYRTPWGAAVNFDGPHSDEVRRFIIENALYWITEFHVDALRLDAVHAIFDVSARPILRELATAVRERGRKLDRHVYTIAESNLNDPRLVTPAEAGGYGLDSQWLDDFQRALGAMLTGERQGPYCDFGSIHQVAKSLEQGFVLDGHYSGYRGRHYGASSRDISPKRFVAFSQNHDQVGNRGGGERLSHLVDFESLKLAAGVVILAPYVPLLFMGEEYAETAPFHYFISHLDSVLAKAVCAGRRQDLATFQQQCLGTDPQAEATFQQSKLQHALRTQDKHRVLRDFYRELIKIRKTLPAEGAAARRKVEVIRDDVLMLGRTGNDCEWLVFFNFGEQGSGALRPPLDNNGWSVLVDSSDVRWLGASGSCKGSVHADPTASLGRRSLRVLTRKILDKNR